MSKTPILLLIFNRPKETLAVFKAIKSARPAKLYVAADGPRNQRDLELCGETRKVIEKIDWPCEVKTLFRNENLGCKIAVSSAIDWFFENVESGIILEDDCLPDPTFFTFCETMLNKYKHNDQIMHINGTNSQFGVTRGTASYYYSHCPQVWGWATWKRAWSRYDIQMTNLDNFINNNSAYTLLKNKRTANFWNKLYLHAKNKNINTWDIQWSFSVMSNNGMAITPNINLVQNIGFGSNSTHTNVTAEKIKQKSQPMHQINLNNDLVVANIEADNSLYTNIYKRNIIDRMITYLKNAL